jgi:transposase
MSPDVSAEWIGRQTPEVQAVVRMLLARIVEQDRRIAQLEAQVSDLQGRLNKSPQNSSLPPSSQHPHAKPPAVKPKTNRKQSGQPGHTKHERPLLPPQQCDRV